MRDINDLLEIVIPEIEKTLEKNKSKKDWRKLSYNEIYNGIIEENRELFQEIPLGEKGRILEEAVDLINYLFFLVYKIKREEEK